MYPVQFPTKPAGVVLQAVFRCDVILLLAPVGLYLILDRQIRLVSGVVTGLATALAAAAASVAVDSVFWQRPVWPELSVLLFNTVDNRCAAEGIANTKDPIREVSQVSRVIKGWRRGHRKICLLPDVGNTLLVPLRRSPKAERFGAQLGRTLFTALLPEDWPG